MSGNIQSKIARAAARIAANWPVEVNGHPISGIEKAILHRMGLGRESGRMPVVSARLWNMVSKAGYDAVSHAWDPKAVSNG